MQLFKDLYLVAEAKFSKSRKVHLLTTLPMFTVYVYAEDLNKINNLPRVEQLMRKACNLARNQIIKIGFPSMHANILIKDLSKETNKVTGIHGGVGGYAVQSSKYMIIDRRLLKDPEHLVQAITHEWAHLWMFNNSHGFRTAVKQYYTNLINDNRANLQLPSEELSGVDKIKVDQLLQKHWMPQIRGLFDKKSILQYPNLTEYILNYNTIDTDSAEFLPHGTMIFLTASIPFKDVIKGDKIYAIKHHSGWILGSEKNRHSSNRLNREIIIPFAELPQYVSENPEEIMDEITRFIRHYLSNSNLNIQQELIHHLRNQIISPIHYALRDLGIRDISKYNFSDFVNNAIEILLPNFETYLQDIVETPQLTIDVYSTYWAKPSHLHRISFKRTIEDALAKEQQRQYENRRETLTDLQGKDYELFRNQMKSLVNWANAYGMSNDSEMWATGIEFFMDLPKQHRTAILKLMDTKYARENLPNRRMQKHHRQQKARNRF